MNPLEQRLEECLTFLETIRKGYKYSITINKPNGNIITANVIGQSYEDKSYPHVFLSVKLKDFNSLPEAIQLESEKLIQAEITSKSESIISLNKGIEILLEKSRILLEL